MVKSMYAAVAGLKAHQSRMDTISNNIANVNTYGFKSMNASFKESMYQTLTRGSAGTLSNGGYGAVNPSLIGYGSMVSAITANFTVGSPSPTDGTLDMYIDGTAFFMVGPMYGEGDAKSPEDVFLSRVGDFSVRNGYLVDSNGRYVYGCTMEKGGEVYDKVEYSGTGTRTVTAADLGNRLHIDETFNNADVKDADGNMITSVPVAGDEVYVNGRKVTVLEASDVGGTQKKISYVTGYPKKGNIVGTSNEKGRITNVAPTFTGTPPQINGITVTFEKESGHTYLGPQYDNGAQVNENGGYDLTDMETLNPLKIPTTCTYYDEDGNPNEETNIDFTTFSIDAAGQIFGTSEATGNTYLLGSIALVNVQNPNGMNKSDGPYYQLGGASGTGNIIQPGGASGSLKSGYLEMANVDIATEFSTMITTQRGFQANSKIISVTDEMLQELVNMKR